MHPYRTAPPVTEFSPGELAWFRRPLLCLVLGLLTACGLKHVDQAPRSYTTQSAAVVDLLSSCTTSGFADETIEWTPDARATGVVISEDYVLTAAHAVRCPDIPSVEGWSANGKHLRFQVERDDSMFPHGAGSDVARLQLAYGGGMGLGIAPPTIRDARVGETCCVQTLRGASCGETEPYYARDGVYLRAEIRPGDSGSGVYCGTDLVGIAVRGGGSTTEFEPLTPYWLEGT